MDARLHARAGGLPGAVDARAQVLAARRPRRERVRRPEPRVRVPADRGLLGGDAAVGGAGDRVAGRCDGWWIGWKGGEHGGETEARGGSPVAIRPSQSVAPQSVSPICRPSYRPAGRPAVKPLPASRTPPRP